MAWTGFTDEQLQQLRNETDEIEEDHTRNNQQRRPQHAKIGGPRRTQGNRNAAHRGREPKQPTKPPHHTENLAPNQMLSRPKEVQNKARQQPPQRPQQHQAPQQRPVHADVQSEQRIDKVNKKSEGVTVLKDAGTPGTDHQGNAEVISQLEDEVENKEVISEEIDEKEGISRELTKMEKFQEDQKKIEAENAKRKALLSMAIADRKKKTQAEAKRLAYIQRELGKIEDLLTSDVRILRDRIEEASRSYCDAQKRYQKAEEEFVAAKLHLHKADDLKESLTEHLYTIIHENEVRKSKKLEELVNKLEVDNLEEFEQQLIEESKPKIPLSPIPSIPLPKENIKSDVVQTQESNQQQVQPVSPTATPIENADVIKTQDANQQLMSSETNSVTVDQAIQEKQSSENVTNVEQSSENGPSSQTGQSKVQEKGDSNQSLVQTIEGTQEIDSKESNAPSAVS